MNMKLNGNYFSRGIFAAGLLLFAAGFTAVVLHFSGLRNYERLAERRAAEYVALEILEADAARLQAVMDLYAGVRQIGLAQPVDVAREMGLGSSVTPGRERRTALTEGWVLSEFDVQVTGIPLNDWLEYVSVLENSRPPVRLKTLRLQGADVPGSVRAEMTFSGLEPGAVQ